MKALSTDTQASIISLLENGKSTRAIASTLSLNHSTISKFRSKHLPTIPKPNHGRPRKLTPVDVRHATRFIVTGKAENATQVTRVLGDATNKSLTSADNADIDLVALAVY